MNPDFLICFNEENFNKEYFNKKILYLLWKYNDLTCKGVNDNDLFPYFDFYCYDCEYISSNLKHVVYLFDDNANFITRISLLSLKDNYFYTSIIDCLFEEVYDHVKDKYKEFYLYWCYSAIVSE